ncbi:MAG TPA: hypothetical protein VGS21_09535, partial [Acidimicrobiales bacterium]|nr:hypothetical protein [Acidimicrobiales bacterium]
MTTRVARRVHATRLLGRASHQLSSAVRSAAALLLATLALISGLLSITVLPAAAASTAVSLGAQSSPLGPNGGQTTFPVSVTGADSKPINISAISGFPAGTTFSGAPSCLVGAASDSFTLTVTVPGPVTPGTYAPVVTVTRWTGGSCPGTGTQSQFSSAASTFQVGQAQTISFTGPGTGTVGNSATLTATGGGSGNPVVFSIDASSGTGVCNVSGTNGTTLNYTGAGSCVVDANQAGNGTYFQATQVSQTVTVGKGTQTISFTPPASGSVGTST